MSDFVKFSGKSSFSRKSAAGQKFTFSVVHGPVALTATNIRELLLSEEKSKVATEDTIVISDAESQSYKTTIDATAAQIGKVMELAFGVASVNAPAAKGKK